MRDNRHVFPLVWPWQDGHGRRLHWRVALKSRPLSLSYLFIIALVYAWLGYGSASKACRSRISSPIICELVGRPYNLLQAPHVFLVTVFTAISFHNGPKHILFVTIVIVTFLQSAEVRIGRKRTLIAFLGVQLATSVAGTLILYTINHFYPEDDFYRSSLYDRHYMGGSLGLFGVFGVLCTTIKRPILAAVCYVGWEFWNGYIYGGVSPIVVRAHAISFSFGSILGMYWRSSDFRDAATIKHKEEEEEIKNCDAV